MDSDAGQVTTRIYDYKFLEMATDEHSMFAKSSNVDHDHILTKN